MGEDRDARAGRDLVAAVAGARAHVLARSAAVAMFTPACLAADRLAVGLAWLRDAGFSVVHISRINLTVSQVDRIWRHQAARFTAERWEVAARAFCAGPAAVAVVTSADGALSVAERLKPLQGPSDPDRLAGHMLRASLGAVNKLTNLVHVPDDTAATVRELPIMLGERGAEVAWNAVLSGRRPPGDAEAVAGLGSALDDGVCFVRSVARLRWRALLVAEAMVAEDAPPALRSRLWMELEWAGAQSWGGWQTIEAWCDRFGPWPAGGDFARWLGPSSVVTQALQHIDTVLAGGHVDLVVLEASIEAAGLAPSRWELLALATQAVAHRLAG